MSVKVNAWLAYFRSKSHYAMCFLAMMLGLVAMPSLAADTDKVDFTVITNAVSFADVIVGIMAIAVAVAGLYVVVNGVKKLVAFLRGA